MTRSMIALALLTLAACGGEQAAQPTNQAAADPALNETQASPAGETATAELQTAGGEARGRATAAREGDGIRITLTASGLAPGSYAAHVHTTGRCEGPKFESAGGHWNPEERQHGRENPQGAHKGDLPNLTVGENGQGTLEFTIPAATLAGGSTPMLDADGAAMMIHAKADDYRTDPTGNAGDRIACGVFNRG
jgi:superoxide dismutase, Cu-Zn family